MELHRRLNEEKEAQVFLKHQSEEKISALQVEISWLKLQVPVTPRISTPIETLALPPQSQDTMTRVPISRSSFTQTRRSVVKQFIRDYQNKIKSAIVPTAALFLDEELAQIKSHIQDYIDDIKKTELKLFQRRLRAGEINLMPLDIQQKTYESILSKMEELILEKKKNQSPYRT
ncbi:unnamed protein product [Acanthosepion pharaonis]|uniref:Uncharacterized protein n=1 Tax=Acanthosepion pharaonis TaxID=158019 RepID=A0A812EZ61_ACAPH|nr:unnamed protein product [Sepia pharaonis]